MKEAAAALYKEIGSSVYRLRRRWKPPMSQEALAKAVGVSRASIANMERGHHRIQIHTLYDIAQALDIEPQDLLPHPAKRAASDPLPKNLTAALSQNEKLAVERLLNIDRRGGKP